MQTQIYNTALWMVLAFTLLRFGIAEPDTPQFGQFFSGEDDDPDYDPISESGEKDSFDFAISLFKKVAKGSLSKSGNCHISPTSVRYALILSYLGAKGTTKTQMQTALRLSNFNEKLVLRHFRHHKEVHQHNATKEDNYTLRIAEKLYFDKKAKLQESMVKNLATDLEQLDFRSAAEPSRSRINAFVEDITNRKIVNLLPVGSVTTSTTMVIVNAIYMKAAWADTFDPRATYDDDFFVEPQGSKKKVKMMRQMVNIPYGSSIQLDCRAVWLRYSGDDISMVILLPNSKVENLVTSLTAEILQDLLVNMNAVTVDLKVPKFKITQSFELTKNLVAMGMKDLFDASKADLSGFTGSKVFVTSVHHKTFISVDEGGTEAAAATALVVGTTSVIVSDAQFKVDRPFVFVIIDNRLNSILFMGLMKDPTAQD